MSQSLSYIDNAVRNDMEVAISQFEKEHGEIAFRDDFIKFLIHYLENLTEFQRKRISHLDKVLENYQQKFYTARELVLQKEDSLTKYYETTKSLSNLFDGK